MKCEESGDSFCWGVYFCSWDELERMQIAATRNPGGTRDGTRNGAEPLLSCGHGCP